jgi:dimethylamine/trimethylamine dehydrogenase
MDPKHEILLRMISEAIFDGHRLAREIDGPDPSVALPFDRERSVPDEASLPAR